MQLLIAGSMKKRTEFQKKLQSRLSELGWTHTQLAGRLQIPVDTLEGWLAPPDSPDYCEPHLLVQIGAVTIIRRLRAPMARKRRDWSGVDWSMRDIDIAKIIGCSGAAVYHARARFAPDTKSPPLHDWSVVDWSQSTAVIAEQMGMTRQGVLAARKKHAPETVLPWSIKDQK